MNKIYILYSFIKFPPCILKLQRFKQPARYFRQFLDNFNVDVNRKVIFLFFYKFKLLYLKSAKTKLHLNCTVHASIIRFTPKASYKQENALQSMEN